MAEKQEKKKIGKDWRIVVWIIAFMVFLGVINSWWSNSSTTGSSSQKSDPVQERMNRINELYAEESSFDKVQKIWDNSIAIVFTSAPDLWIEDEIDSITRWQAMNLSKEVNGVASVKTYVWWTAQMYCIATKGQVNECSDYR